MEDATQPHLDEQSARLFARLLAGEPIPAEEVAALPVTWREIAQRIQARESGVSAAEAWEAAIGIWPNASRLRAAVLAVVPRAEPLKGTGQTAPGAGKSQIPGEPGVYRAEIPAAPGETKRNPALILVESPADADLLQCLGLSAWAICDQALTESEVAEARERKPVFLLIPVQDSVRQERLTAIAMQLGPMVMIAPTLPGGHRTLADWLQQPGLTREQVQSWLQDARPWVDVALKQSKGCPAYELEEHIEQLTTLISALPEALQRRYLRAAEKALDVPASYLRVRAETSGNGHGPRGLAELRGGRLCFRGEVLTNFSAAITHELIVDDGQNRPAVRYSITGQLAESDPLDLIEVEAEDFESMKWLASWGARAMVDVSPGKVWMVRRAIQELSIPEMKRERVYTFSGWTTIGGRHVFLTASGAITSDGFDPQVRVDLGTSNLRYYRLPEPPADAREAMRASLGFLKLAPLRVTAPLWAAMFAAPLTVFYPLNAVLWVYGTTQSLKSTLTHLALTHFGPRFVKGREFHAGRDWMSTLTDLEYALFVTKDLVLVIDDFRPQAAAGDSRALRFKADQVVRSVGNRSARGRANADLSERLQRPPRGLVISTSELPLTDQSTVGRTIVVPVEKGDVVVSENGSGPLDRAQQLAGEGGPGLYAQAMSAYIRWLAANWDSLPGMLSADYEAANQYARSVFPSSQSRLMDYYAILLTGARTALRFAASIGALSAAEHQRLSEEAFPAAFVELLSDQSQRVAGQSPVLRMTQALDALLAGQKIYLAPKSGAVQPPVGANLVGWYGVKHGQQRLYLLIEVCLQQAREYWQRTGENFDTLPDALKREMAQAGVVIRQDDKHYESIVRLGDAGRKRLLVVDVERLHDCTGLYLWPESTGEDESEESE